MIIIPVIFRWFSFYVTRKAKTNWFISQNIVPPAFVLPFSNSFRQNPHLFRTTLYRKTPPPPRSRSRKKPRLQLFASCADASHTDYAMATWCPFVWPFSHVEVALGPNSSTTTLWDTLNGPENASPTVRDHLDCSIWILKRLKCDLRSRIIHASICSLYKSLYNSCLGEITITKWNDNM